MAVNSVQGVLHQNAYSPDTLSLRFSESVNYFRGTYWQRRWSLSYSIRIDVCGCDKYELCTKPLILMRIILRDLSLGSQVRNTLILGFFSVMRVRPPWINIFLLWGIVYYLVCVMSCCWNDYDNLSSQQVSLNNHRLSASSGWICVYCASDCKDPCWKLLSDQYNAWQKLTHSFK